MVRMARFGTMLVVAAMHVLSAAVSAGQLVPADDINPPPPEAPGVIARAPGGRATVRAFRLVAPIRLDGRLDEALYQAIPPIDGFIQTVPREGELATERTEVWVFFDDTQIVIAARCWDSASPERWVANEMRRDTAQLRQNDHFGVLFDTFHDRRNGVFFYTNPLGARADSAVTDEGNNNADWNPVWEARTGQFEGGWTAELSIPFKSLRYAGGGAQTWGVNFRRSIRHKNEWTHLTLLPASDGGSAALMRISAAGTLVGLDLPPASKNIEIKPYGIAGLTTDRLLEPPVANDPSGDVGVDVKYGVTANLTADVTVNTDFAQVEVDEQQVNLTRFSLVFPEKREFFLEGRGIFDFGRGSGANAGGSAPALFYSRRIGLTGGREVPIDVGGRLTGKVGAFSVGVLNIQTGDEPISESPATNFTVVRVKRDILRRSTIGLLFANRSDSTIGDGSNQTYGVDAAFSFFQDVSMGGYYAETRTPGLDDDQASYQARAAYEGDRYGMRADFLHVGDHFNPEVGFVRRDDFDRTAAGLRFSPRPQSIDWVRRFTWEVGLEYLENGAGQLETRQHTGRFNIELENSDQFSIDVGRNYELLVEPFRVATGISIPTGSYTFDDVQVGYSLGQQRRVSGRVSVQYGGFYDGTVTAYTFSGARVSVTDQLSVEPSLSINRVELPADEFTSRVYRARTDYAFSPLMFVSALVQYASADSIFSSNLRFRWEYAPGSEIFVVYTDERDTLEGGPTKGLRNRAFVVKVNRLVRF